MISFTLPLRCMPKKRPRVVRGHTFMPAEYEKWRSAIHLYLRAQRPPCVSGPLAMAVLARYNGSRTTDVDNAIGGILDSADGVLFNNDRQICALISIGIGEAKGKGKRAGMSDPPLADIVAALRVLLDELERADVAADCTYVGAVEVANVNK